MLRKRSRLCYLFSFMLHVAKYSHKRLLLVHKIVLVVNCMNRVKGPDKITAVFVFKNPMLLNQYDGNHYPYTWAVITLNAIFTLPAKRDNFLKSHLSMENVI